MSAHPKEAPPHEIQEHFSKENLNPLSSKGRLEFTSFAFSLGAIVVFNLVVWAALRSELISARMALDRERALAYYILWFLFATLGFTCVTNAFIKRWACVLGDRDLPKILKSVIRLSLLSPLLAYATTFVTFLFFPRSPLLEVDDGGSRTGSLSLMFAGMALSICASVFLPDSIFGLERIDFRSSVAPIVTYQPGGLRFPDPQVLKPVLAAATPGLRYLFWVVSDAMRTRMLSAAVGSLDSPLCQERLGYLGVEVPDCYFSNLRKMAAIAPIVTPYFALYFETLYRQEAASQFKLELDSKIAQRQRELAKNPNYTSGDGTTLHRGFVYSLITLSNQLELLEAGPMFVERIHFLSPAALLHAYGSPEFPIVEAGQDIQRIGLVEKLIPIFEFQIAGVRNYLETDGRALGIEEVTIEAEVRDLQTRIAAVKRDPLMIGK